MLGESLFDEENGAVSVPVTLGVAALMLGQRSRNSEEYRDAAERQSEMLLKHAPRYANGAISHRHGNAELWSDAVAMFPPFLAYQAVANNATELMHQAVVQIGLYKDLLRIENGATEGLWKHIVGSVENLDEGAWSTGNAWTAYGVARVRATLGAWPTSNVTLAQDKERLDAWIGEILDAAISTDNDDSGLL